MTTLQPTSMAQGMTEDVVTSDAFASFRLALAISAEAYKNKPV
jgi:hypothetical protein